MGNISNPEQWATRERLRFIERAAYWRGHLQREEIATVFGTSLQQCSADLQKYQELCPGALYYNGPRKCYEGLPEMKCRLHRPDLEEAMATFLEDEGSWTTQPSPAPAHTPAAISRIQLPRRDAALPVQRRAFLAVLHRRRLRIHYHSIHSHKTTWRWIAPHAFGHDGYRWHLRAWCEENLDYRDFVLSRIRSADWPDSRPTHILPPDTAWETWTQLDLTPNQELSKEQQAAIIEDFGLKGGRLTIRVREAMLPYTLDHLRLPGALSHGKPFLVPVT